MKLLLSEKDKERSIKTEHSTAAEAAKVAFQANVGKLYFGHLSARYDNAEKHLIEARMVFEKSFEAVEGEIVKL